MSGFRFVGALAAFMSVGLLHASNASAQQAADVVLSEDNVLRDRDIPVAGNPKGDITIVEYFDYQCPYCRTIHTELVQIVQEDKNIRLVFKDWPVFGGVSVYAAKLTLAAKYQGKFVETHHALIGAKSRLTEARVREFMTQAGVDVDRALLDLADNHEAIDATLARNDAQAKAFGFPGTPAFIIGKFRVPGVLDAKGFKQAIHDARASLRK